MSQENVEIVRQMYRPGAEPVLRGLLHEGVQVDPKLPTAPRPSRTASAGRRLRSTSDIAISGQSGERVPFWRRSRFIDAGESGTGRTVVGSGNERGKGKGRWGAV